jgi:hypothetical protein
MPYSKHHTWLFLISVLLLFVPYLYISQYASPVADDFVCAANGKANSFLGLQLSQYLGWSGRYSANILIFLNPLVYNSFLIYKLVPVVLMVLIVLSNHFFVKTLIGKHQTDIQSFIISVLFSTLFFYQMPILSEGIYWYTGSVTYQLGTVFTMLYIGLLIRYTQGWLFLKSRIIHISILTLLLIISIGFNEVQMLALALFACISLLVVIKNRLQHRSLFIYLFAITVVFSGILFFAPGNENRANQAVNNHRFFYSLFMSVSQTIRFFLDWISSIPLLILSFLYYFLNKKLAEHYRLFSASFYLSPFYSTALLFIIIFIAVFPPYWATGMLGQHRTLNVAYYLFLILWFINLTTCFNFYKNELTGVKPINRQIQATLLVIAVVAMFFSKNGYDLLTDIFYGRARAFDEQMTARNVQLKLLGDTVYFHPILDPPKSLFLYDVKEDPANWLNQSYNLYFECKDKLIIKGIEPIESKTNEHPKNSLPF